MRATPQKLLQTCCEITSDSVFRQLGPKLTLLSKYHVLMCHFEFQNLSNLSVFSTFLWFFLNALFLYHLCAFAILRIGSLWSELLCEFPHSVPSLSHWISSEVRTACFQVRWKPFWLLMVSPIMYRWYLGKYSSVHKYLQYFVCDKKHRAKLILQLSKIDLLLTKIPQQVWHVNYLSGASTKDFHTHQNRPECSIRIVGFLFFPQEAITLKHVKAMNIRVRVRSLDWICDQSVFISSRSHIRGQGIHGIISLRSTGIAEYQHHSWVNI